MSDFNEVHERTVAVYENNAAGWDRHRSRVLREKPWLDRFVQSLKPRALLLDVGCGAGEPISKYLMTQGCSVTGIDSSQSMIDICESRFPDQTWMVMDMRELALHMQFDGIVAWDSFFHLNQDEQRSTLQLFIRHLRPGGTLLLTVGHLAGEVLGSVEGEAVYHSSLSPQEYKQILCAAGFQDVELKLEDKMCDRTVLMARRFV